MLREDIGKAGITYRDDSGRVVDFHALKHTFISNLERHGVHPKTAQNLARHGSISLTMDCYSHMLKEDEWSALVVRPGTDADAYNEQKRRVQTARGLAWRETVLTSSIPCSMIQ